MLAYTGRFDVDLLRQTFDSGKPEDEPGKPASESEEKQRRRKLWHAKAEARARYNEGRHLATQRDIMNQGGASQPAGSGQAAVTFSNKQLDILKKWGCGMLRKELSKATMQHGHGRLESAAGEYMDIGGSTGGISWRTIDGWVPPDWRQLLQEPANPLLA